MEYMTEHHKCLDSIARTYHSCKYKFTEIPSEKTDEIYASEIIDRNMTEGDNEV